MNKQRRRKNRKGTNVSRQHWARTKRRVFRNLRAEPLEDRRLLTALASDSGIEYNSYHNYLIPEDVNSDYYVSPADALSVINDMNTSGSRVLSQDDGDETSSVQKLDTNNDGAVSPVDALMVIDTLNAEGENGIQKLVAISLEAQEVDADGDRVLDENGDPIPIDRVKSGDDFALGVTVQDLRSDGQGVAAVYFDIGYSNDLVESPNLETESDALTELFTVGGIDPSSFEDPQLFEDQWIPTEAYSDAFSANPWRYWDADSGMWTDPDDDMVPDEFDEMGGTSFFDQFGTDEVPVMHGVLTADLRFDDPGTVTFEGNPAELSPEHDVISFPVENVDPVAIQFESVDVTIFKPVYARDDTVATLEDTPLTVSYMDNDELDAGWVDDNPSADLALDSFTQPDNGEVIDNEDGTFTYTPDENYNNDSGTPDSFTYTMTDGLGNTDSATVTITVEAENDPPTAAANTVTTNEDEAYVFSASDFNFSDVDEGDSLSQVRITSLETAGSLEFDGAGVSEDQEIARNDIDAGKLTFMPDPDENGDDYATFRFEVGDGMAFSVADYPMTIDVAPVQDAPTASANTVTTNEDEAYVFSASDFNFSDVDEGDTLAAVRITSLPTPGSLDFDGAGVSEDQEISRDDIEAGELTFTPDPDENGDDYATFRFEVGDGMAFSVADYPMTIDVAPVQDAPTASANTVT
ncbi:MAG: Ig-like domain-containing protein, partial [Pirellulaceae bacterium]